MGDLFEFEAIKQAKSQRAIPTDNTENGIPYIVQSMFNNMVSRKVNKKWLIENNEPPVSGNRIVLGVTLPAISYQPKEFGASQVITAKSSWLNVQNGIFIVIAISKLMNQFSYNRKPGMQIYKDMVIKLPTKKGKIDFEFIESFISDLESQRLTELEVERKTEIENYLLASELKNYTLKVDEQKAISDFENGKLSWSEFNLGNLFEFEAIKQAKSQREIPTDNTENGIPYIVQSMFNNMVSRKVNKKWLIENNEPPVSGNRIVLGVTLPAISYQPRDFGASQVITAKSDYLSEMNGNFISVVISKLMYQFSYGRKPGMQIYKDMKIQLPSLKGHPDYELMNRFIVAIQKLVIKEIVLLADRKIEATKSVLKNNYTLK